MFTYSINQASEIRKFHVAVEQRRLTNVQNSAMHLQRCFFLKYNLLLFNCFRCRRRRRCLNSLLLWSTNFATVVTRSNISLLYYLKVKICFVQGYNDIGVIIATNWRHCLFYLQLISRHRELLFQNRSRELFPPIAAPMIVKFKRNL